MLRTFPCIIKHHGSVKYLKYVISAYRSSSNKSNHPSKILAASSTASPAVTENFNKDPHPRQSGSTEGKTSSGDGTTIFPPQTSGDNKGPENELQQYLKPVAQPDITSTVQDSPGKISPQKDEESRAVKLLDAVKPSDLEWHKQVTDIKSLPKCYKSLSKIRLTGLVVLTTLAGYGMAPGVVEPTSLLCMILGTGLTSAAANSVNQILEVPYDSQMTRTKNRVLTRGALTPLHASTFAFCCATVGLSTLYFGTNPLTAALGATNLILYTSVYTPLKRCSITNTWLGSVVGSIPPLMGWAACTGSLNSGGLLLGAILYAWQFPHFNALSWNLRSDYSRAGYRMTSVIDPDLCRRTALRYSILILGLCSSAPLLELTTWTFAFDSLPLNCYLVYCAWQFYKKADSASSRKLFRLSLIHLPALMFLMFIGKKYASKEEKLDKNLS